MKKTLRIQKAINRYKAFLRHKRITEKSENNIEEYNLRKFELLREIVALKTENPTKYKVVCVLDKIIWN